MKNKLIIFLISISIISILISLYVIYPKLKIPQQNIVIKMPRVLKIYGKIPILEVFDTITMITSAWWFIQDEKGNNNDYPIYYYDKKLNKIRGLYNPLNKGNFIKGYMYGVDNKGRPKQVWEE